MVCIPSMPFNVLLIIMLNGCNEMITLFVLISSASLMGYYLFIYKKLPFLIISLYVVNLISACFMLVSPGILHRGSLLGTGSIIFPHIIDDMKRGKLSFYLGIFDFSFCEFFCQNFTPYQNSHFLSILFQNSSCRIVLKHQPALHSTDLAGYPYILHPSRLFL